MSHEIEIRADGTGAAAYSSNQPAWHQLGHVHAGEGMTVAEAEEHVPEFFMQVETKPMVVDVEVDGTRQYVPVPFGFASVRADGKVVGMHGSAYKFAQGHDQIATLEGLMDTFDLRIEALATLAMGSRTFLLARPAEGIQIGGDSGETLTDYLCIANSFDRSLALTLFRTPVRVECQNMLTFAMGDAKKHQRLFRLRHLLPLDRRIEELRTGLGLTTEYTRALGDLGNRLVQAPLSDAQWQEFLEGVIPSKAEPTPSSEAYAQNVRAEIDNVYRLPGNLDRIRGTQWGALQAVIEWDQYVRVGERDGKWQTEDEKKFQRIAFDARQPAVDLAVKVLAGITPETTSVAVAEPAAARRRRTTKAK